MLTPSKSKQQKQDKSNLSATQQSKSIMHHFSKAKIVIMTFLTVEYSKMDDHYPAPCNLRQPPLLSGYLEQKLSTSMKSLVVVAVEVKQAAAVAVTNGASASKQQRSRYSRSRWRAAATVMGWLHVVASVTIGCCFAQLHLRSVACCFEQLLFGILLSPISKA